VKFGMKMDHENIYALSVEYCVSVINHWSYACEIWYRDDDGKYTCICTWSVVC